MWYVLPMLKNTHTHTHTFIQRRLVRFNHDDDVGDDAQSVLNECLLRGQEWCFIPIDNILDSFENLKINFPSDLNDVYFVQSCTHF